MNELNFSSSTTFSQQSLPQNFQTVTTLDLECGIIKVSQRNEKAQAKNELPAKYEMRGKIQELSYCSKKGSLHEIYLQ